MIAIIKYNAGNSRSVKNALDRLSCESIITDDPNIICTSEHVIFPGVGEASSAMHYLKEHKLDDCIRSLKQPFLGICLGMQLMCNSTEEGNINCLNIFDTKVKKFPPEDKVPHIGWNNFSTMHSPLFSGIDPQEDVYYVHSFYAQVNEDTIAECDYILPFSAALQKDNFYGTQFHPEKSAEVGIRIIQNFLKQ